MEREDDVQLIQRTLSGDDTAFGVLLRRHQKSVHALVWRKVGDFHIAEDITQDTFLQAYKKLSTLKNHHQFAGWLYVIADRLCIDWSRKRALPTQSLEDTPVAEIERASYTHHASEQQQTEIAEYRHELVKKLLAKLPESERTVVTLYYLGEMTTKEIGKFLGVSVGTIKSRLRRGRERLREDEELMIQEVCGGVQIPSSLGENVMREIPYIEPLPPAGGKPPIVPWAIATSTAILAVIVFGISNQYSARFQQPYSFDATSEMTVELIEAPVVLDLPSKLDVRNQVGQTAISGEGGTNGSQTSKMLLGATVEQYPIFFEKQADQLTIGKSMTWVHTGDKSDPSEMALVRTEFNGGISYSSKEYVGTQTIPELMNVFDEIYNLKHSDTIVTVFSRESIAEINPDEVTGLHAWQDLLLEEGISSQFTLTEIDARYPRNTWLQLLLKRGIIIENLADYFLLMAHRYRLAFLKDNPYLWKTEIHSVSSIDAWEAYKITYIDKLVRYYTQGWKYRD